MKYRVKFPRIGRNRRMEFWTRTFKTVFSNFLNLFDSLKCNSVLNAHQQQEMIFFIRLGFVF